MEEIELGTIIAVRVLSSAKLSDRVEVRIGTPTETGEADFITPYQILGVGDQKVRFAVGLDAVQSLELVFQIIGADLHRSKEYDLKWADGDDPGFPAPI